MQESRVCRSLQLSFLASFLAPAEGGRRGLATKGASNRPRATRLCVARWPGGAIAPTAAIYEKPAQHPTATKRTRQKTCFVPSAASTCGGFKGCVVRKDLRTIQNSFFVNVRRKDLGVGVKQLSANSTETDTRPRITKAHAMCAPGDPWSGWCVEPLNVIFFRESVDNVRQMEYNNLGGAFYGSRKIADSHICRSSAADRTICSDSRHQQI